MENFVAFLRDNWKFLVEISIPLVSLIVLCFVKKTKITLDPNVWSDLMDALPLWINQAERELGTGNGKAKLKLVLKNAISFLAPRVGVSEKVCLDRFGDAIITHVEEILNTPQKKGDQ